jgi:citrate synthase
METGEQERLIDKYAKQAAQHNTIDPHFYSMYNVKRGLRNEDGTGVLVGLTEIGDVHGYILDEGERIPVHGRLRYRGYDVADLVAGFQKEKRFGYEETVYLILFGKLPNKEELAEFNELLGSKRMLPKNFPEDIFLNTPGRDIMNKLSRAVLAFYSFDDNPEDNSIRNVLRQCIDLIAQFPSLTAYAYQAKKHYFDKESLYIHSPKPELSTAENLLLMTRPDTSYTRLEAELLDLAMVLHAEHGGGNNSAFTIHVVSSACTDTYAAIAAGIGSLKGARHGGANIKVMGMMQDIKANVKDWKDADELARYVKRIIDKEVYDKTGLVYGFGHAVYTLSDPRAVLLKKKADELAKAKNCTDEFNLYLLMEEVVPAVFAKVKGNDKHMAPNVDFYSGFVYHMLNIPSELYTPIFAMARMAGWSAHRMEEIVSGTRIMRPAFRSVAEKRDYVPLEERN